MKLISVIFVLFSAIFVAAEAYAECPSNDNTNCGFDTTNDKVGEPNSLSCKDDVNSIYKYVGEVCQLVCVDGAKLTTIIVGEEYPYTCACPPGEYNKIDENNVGACTPCPKGSYGDEDVIGGIKDSCHLCLAGKTTAVDGSKQEAGKPPICSDCTNTTGVDKYKESAWDESSGTANTCIIETCSSGYTKNTEETLCDANKFNVEYDGNGADGGTAPLSPTECTYMSECKAPENSYSKSGYSFAGWKCSGGNTNCNGVISGNDLSQLSYGTAIKLTAQWQQCENTTGDLVAEWGNDCTVVKCKYASGLTSDGNTAIGYRIQDNECVKCDDGKSCDGKESQRCPVGWYCKAGHKDPCPTGATSLSGSIEKEYNAGERLGCYMIGPGTTRMCNDAVDCRKSNPNDPNSGECVVAPDPDPSNYCKCSDESKCRAGAIIPYK
jgi:hypothetical protein